MSCHPFESAAQFERAIAPFMLLPRPRHNHIDLWGVTFRYRLLREGVGLATSHEHQVRTGEFVGTFVEFLRKLFTDMARYFPDAEDYAPEHVEIARLYGITLPASDQNGERQSCSSPSSSLELELSCR